MHCFKEGMDFLEHIMWKDGLKNLTLLQYIEYIKNEPGNNLRDPVQINRNMVGKNN